MLGSVAGPAYTKLLTIFAGARVPSRATELDCSSYCCGMCRRWAGEPCNDSAVLVSLVTIKAF